jgi:tetratricopeptide (TPR) repeat protein
VLAEIHLRAGNNRAAAAALTRLTAVNENAYAENLRLAELLEPLGDTRGAAAALERAIYMYPFEISLHTKLAELYGTLGDRAKVVRERAAVVALKPVDEAEARYQLALAMSQAGDRAGARREVLRALEVAPSFERAQELLLQLREGGG